MQANEARIKSRINELDAIENRTQALIKYLSNKIEEAIKQGYYYTYVTDEDLEVCGWWYKSNNPDLSTALESEEVMGKVSKYFTDLGYVCEVKYRPRPKNIADISFIRINWSKS